MPTIICERCQRAFHVTPNRVSTARFCSHACAFPPVTAECAFCGVTFRRKPSQIERNPSATLFCGRSCKYAHARKQTLDAHSDRLGEPVKGYIERRMDEGVLMKDIAAALGCNYRTLMRHMRDLGIERRDPSESVALQWADNEERRQQLSREARERAALVDITGDNNPAKNPDARKKISEAKRGPKNAMYGKFGEENHSWKGGKVTYRGAGWIGIREQARRRDGYKCRRCGGSRLLEVHHIVPYRETQDNGLENLVTLCHSCHRAVEHHGATFNPI